VRLGAHLPLADLGGGIATAGDLAGYATAARELGFATLAANDHLFWRRPWLDGPTALASVAAAAGDLTLATSLALPVVRHPAVVAKMLTSLAALAQGPVVGGLGPGSSRVDLEAVGVPYDERWARFDEALRVVRALVRGEPTGPTRFYPVQGRLDPAPQPPPQIWFGSWGSDQRLAAMASVADGWFASAYNATPEQYAAARARLDGHLRAAGREPDAFPDAVATTWLFVTESRTEADRVLVDVLAPTLGRDPGQLAHLPVGSAEHCAGALAAYAAAGARELLVWPVRDGVAQLERCAAVAQAAGPGWLRY
jgi:alkanesulfonate monooxygenase SsuD/methylene tetrahydromethanopterin reductase-like flavin-dependent oxidoreductase (luciferase family)